MDAHGGDLALKLFELKIEIVAKVSGASIVIGVQYLANGHCKRLQ